MAPCECLNLMLWKLTVHGWGMCLHLDDSPSGDIGSMAVVDEDIAVVDKGIVVMEKYMVAVEEGMEHIVIVDEAKSCGPLL